MGLPGRHDPPPCFAPIAAKGGEESLGVEGWARGPGGSSPARVVGRPISCR